MTGRIRLGNGEDAEAIAALYAPYVSNTAISFEVDPPSVNEIKARMLAVSNRFPWLVCEGDKGTILGYAYASSHRERPAYRWSTDCAVYVDESYHRRGIGRSLYTSLFALLRLLGYFRVYAGITLPNEASIRLHESMGFEHVGTYHHVGFKLGRWHDVAWLQLALRASDDAPGEPRGPQEAADTKEWLQALALGETHFRLRRAES